jgi:periplasmic divalent cation tolerance protein
MNAETLWLVITSLPNQEAAHKLAKVLVHSQLVACAQVLPSITSIYIWEGVLCEETEYLLLLKTPKSKYAELESQLRSLHPYQEPEILAIEAEAVSESYLKWAIAATLG